MASKMERESLFSDSQFHQTALHAISMQTKSAVFCDVIMRICGKEMFAHSNILAATSPYFHMFLSQDLPRQFSQRSPQIIEIQIEGSNPSHLYGEALENIVEYMYTGKLKVKTSNAFEMIEIARIMQLNSVVIFCEAFLQGKLPGASETVISPPSVMHSVGTSTDDTATRDAYKFRGNKYVSVATLVNPQLLGLENIRKESISQKTQTSERDFVEANSSKTGRPRGRPRKHPLPDGNENNTADPNVESEGHNSESAETGEVPVEASDETIENADMPEGATPVSDGEAAENENDAANEPHQDPEESHAEDEEEMEEKRKAPSAVSILKPKTEDASENVTETESDTPVSPPTRRSARKFKPTFRLREASRNMLVDECTSNEQDENNDDFEGDDDEDDLQVLPVKKRRGRPNKTRPKRTHALTTKLIQAEQLIDRLTAKPENPNEEDPFTKGDDPSPNKQKRKREDDDADEVIGSGDENIEDLEDVIEELTGDAHTSPETPNVSVSRSGRVRTIRATASALKKYVGPKYNCNVSSCGFSTNRVREMSNHRKLHKLEQNVCYYCENKYDHRDDLVQHLEKHKGPMPFYCPVCELRFKTRTQLTLHIPKHSDVKPYKCEVCGVSFKWKHAVKNHMVVHSNKKDHLCDVCGYATAHKSQLKAHRLIHTGNTFKCSFPGCDFQATKRQNLKYHMFSHTQEKPHTCEICGQNFSLVKNLRRHMLLHSSDSKHTCEKCEFHTTRFDKLKEHLLKQHAVGTPPEKRVRVSELVMQNFVGTPEEAEAAGLIVKRDTTDHAELEEQLEELPHVMGTEVVMETITAADGTQVRVVKTSEIGELDGTETLIGDEDGQQIEFFEMPSETIVIQSIEGEEDQITLPIVTQDGTTIHAAVEGDDKDCMQYTEIMIPVSQLSDFVQHVTYVSQ